MSFHHSNHVKKTRLARRCDWCGERIEKGDPSVATSGIFEGDFYQGRYHPECYEAINRYYERHKCWGEEMPDWLMNRGGIEERGEPENNDPKTFQSLGQNPREIPDGEWVRVYLSGTGNVETFACHSLKLTYTIISD